MMGFNKRYLNKEKIVKVYRQGLPNLISLIVDSECLIFEDEFSEEISDIILNDDYMNMTEKLSQLVEKN